MNSRVVDFKGTRNGLVIVFDPSKEFEEIKSTLRLKMESARGFFSGAKFSIADKHHQIPTKQKYELENICRQYGMIPNSENDILIGSRVNAATTQQVNSAINDYAEAAVLVKRSLRSGQRITYAGHVVVMGDINSGAEVISGGNVVVLGKCRGVIHAGVDGNKSAMVIARELLPTGLSIAGRRLAIEQAEQLDGSYSSARLSGEQIVFA
ncbi:MAG: septum site-determining protein MinC [Pelotomaculum sp.]